MPPRKPSRALLDALLQRILDAQPPQAKAVRALISFYFDRAKAGHDTPITRDQIFQSLDVSAVEIGRTKKKVDEYFQKHSDEPIRAEVLPSDHVLRFTANRQSHDKVCQFWAPYFTHFNTTLLHYPEPQFFRHRTGAYMRHTLAHSRREKATLGRMFNIEATDLMASFSFVPSGFSQAAARLYECFQFNGADIMHARALRPEDDDLADGHNNVILIGAPSTSRDVIASLEQQLPMRSDSHEREGKSSINTFTVVDPTNKKKPRREQDQIQEEEISEDDHVPTPLTKWAIVTRRRGHSHHASSERMVTVLSGHSRSVQAVVNYLTNENDVGSLLEGFRGKLPEEFQILFKVDMSKRWGDLEPKKTTPVERRRITTKVARERKQPPR